MRIEWDGGAIGKYIGHVEHGPFSQPPNGFLKGETFDETLGDGAPRVGWVSERLVARFE